MKKTYKGSCHCGAVRFEVDLDLSAGTGRCNCSFCAKARSWGALTKPSEFRLLAGQDALSDYQFGTRSGHHRFCSGCGLHTFGEGHVEEIGGDFVSINLACLDEVDDAELATLPITFQNGRDNAWWTPPAETRHL